MANPFDTLVLFPLIKKLFNFKYEGLEHISKRENYIFAMNHQGALDLFLAQALIVPYTKKDLSMIVLDNAYDNPFLKPLFKRWHTIRVSNSAQEKNKAIQEGIKALEKGNNVLIFPEGYLVGGAIGELTRAFTGVTRLSLLTRKKIIPIGISGSYNAWKFPMSVASRIYHLPEKIRIQYKPISNKAWINDVYNFFEFNFRHQIKMRFGKEIDICHRHTLNLDMFTEENRRALRGITTEIMVSISQLAGQRYNYDL